MKETTLTRGTRKPRRLSVIDILPQIDVESLVDVLLVMVEIKKKRKERIGDEVDF